MLKSANYFRRINQSYSYCRVCKSFAGLYNILLDFDFIVSIYFSADSSTSKNLTTTTNNNNILLDFDEAGVGLRLDLLQLLHLLLELRVLAGRVEMRRLVRRLCCHQGLRK
jgi:hypothetical protein